MRSLSTRTTGLLILALGAWGGVVPFIGHYFHFALGPDKSWAWTTGRLYLSVIPAAVAVLGGLMLISAGWRPHARLGALLAIAAGIWFAVGPDVSHLWNAAGAQGAAHGSKFIRMLEMVTYHTGLGALLAALGGYALPRFITAPDAVAEPAAAGTRGPVSRRRADRDEALAGGALAGGSAVAAERGHAGAGAAERERTDAVPAEDPRVGTASEREPAGTVAAERDRAGTGTPAAAGGEYAGDAPAGTAGAREEPARATAAPATHELADEPTGGRGADTAETTRLRPATAETATTPGGATAEPATAPAAGPVSAESRNEPIAPEPRSEPVATPEPRSEPVATPEPRDEPATTPTDAPAAGGAGQYAGAVPASAGGAARPHTVRRRRGGLLGALFSRR